MGITGSPKTGDGNETGNDEMHIRSRIVQRSLKARNSGMLLGDVTQTEQHLQTRRTSIFMLCLASFVECRYGSRGTLASFLSWRTKWSRRMSSGS